MVNDYIILAEDDEDDRDLFSEALTQLKFPPRLELVKDGKELMEFLTKAGKFLPKLIFLDLNMPLKDGFQSLRELKQNETLKDIPVIIFTTSIRDQDITESYNLGAHLYVHKPGSYEKLSQLIQKILLLDFVKSLGVSAKNNLVYFAE